MTGREYPVPVYVDGVRIHTITAYRDADHPRQFAVNGEGVDAAYYERCVLAMAETMRKAVEVPCVECGLPQWCWYGSSPSDGAIMHHDDCCGHEYAPLDDAVA